MTLLAPSMFFGVFGVGGGVAAELSAWLALLPLSFFHRLLQARRLLLLNVLASVPGVVAFAFSSVFTFTDTDMLRCGPWGLSIEMDAKDWTFRSDAF